MSTQKQTLQHMDIVTIDPPWFAFTKILDSDKAEVAYHELWNQGKFESGSYSLEEKVDLHVLHETKDSVGTVVRKLVDDRYLICVVVGNTMSGMPSDMFYVIRNVSDIRFVSRIE